MHIKHHSGSHTDAHTQYDSAQRLHGGCPITSPWRHTDLFRHHGGKPALLLSLKDCTAFCCIARGACEVTLNMTQRSALADTVSLWKHWLCIKSLYQSKGVRHERAKCEETGLRWDVFIPQVCSTVFCSVDGVFSSSVRRCCINRV